MKRDDDYIRQLLLEAEESDDLYIRAKKSMSSDQEELKRYMHAQWLSDAGLLLEVDDCVFRITNQGHDYVAVIRSNTVWNKTKVAASAVGGVTLSMMKDIAIGIAKQELGRLGVPFG